MEKRERTSPLAIYAVGLVVFVYGALFSLYRLSDWLIAAGLALIAYAVCARVLPKETYLVEKPPAIQTKDERFAEAAAEANGYLDRIRSANDRIADSQISAKLSRIEELTQKIFDVAMEKKEVRDVRRFVSYYLPTCVKLLDTYLALDEQSIKGENIRSTQEKIVGLLATIESAFEKYLDEMFSDTAMDVDAEITVMEQILTQEGLINRGEFGKTMNSGEN